MLLEIVRSDDSNGALVSDADQEIVASAYIGYRSVLSALYEIFELLVTHDMRQRVKTIISLGLYRVCELRKLLGHNSSGSAGRVLHASSQRLQLPMCAESFSAVVTDIWPVERVRFNHLLKTFAASSVDTKPRPNPLDSLAVPKGIPDVVHSTRCPAASVGRMSREQAVTKIASLFRMWRARKDFRKNFETELERLGILPPLEDDSRVAEARLFVRQRREEARHEEERWKTRYETSVAEIRSQIDKELQTGFVRETRKRIWDFKEKYQRFPVNVDEILNPAAVAKSAFSAPKKTLKKNSNNHPPLTVQTVSTLRKLTELIESFSMDPDFSSRIDKDAVFAEMKALKIEKINNEISRLNSPDSPPVIPNPDVAPIEQDIIDLVKSGILRPSQQLNWGDVIASDFEVKWRLFDEVVVPIASREISSGPLSVLLYGPSGCGKTLLAEAVAVAANAAFFHLQSATGNVSAELILKVAVQLAPSVLFIEDLDSVDAPMLPSKKADLKSKAAPRKAGKAGSITPELIEKYNQQPIAQVALIACTRLPSVTDLKKVFINKVFVGIPTESKRVKFIEVMLSKCGVPQSIVRRSQVLILALARLCQRLTIEDTKRIIENVVTPDRVERLPKSALRIGEFTAAISHLPKVPEDQLWQDFVTSMTVPTSLKK